MHAWNVHITQFIRNIVCFKTTDKSNNRGNNDNVSAGQEEDYPDWISSARVCALSHGAALQQDTVG